MDYKSALIGLGNPGEKYRMTRHNYGFMLIDHVLELAASRKSMAPERLEESGDYELWQVKMSGAYRLLVKPQTYMNLSGKAVSKICGRHGLAPDRIVVAHDELDLPFGRMKLKQGGGNNGHRGLESIEEYLGTGDFFRLRLGIGRSDAPYADVSDWVLSPFPAEQVAAMKKLFPQAVKGLDILFRRSAHLAFQQINSFSLEESADS